MKLLCNLKVILISTSFCIPFLSVITKPAKAALPGISCDDVRPLISWYSHSRRDNFATTDPLWSGPLGVSQSPDYKAYRNEGYVLRSQRSGSIPLYSWYSPSRGDNFLTSDPRWSNQQGEVKFPDYRFVRVEGYIISPSAVKPENTVPLDSSWSPSRKDNFASTDPMWTGETGKSNSPDYRLYRREGYIYELRHFSSCTYGNNNNAQDRIFVKPEGGSGGSENLPLFDQDQYSGLYDPRDYKLSCIAYNSGKYVDGIQLYYKRIEGLNESNDGCSNLSSSSIAAFPMGNLGSRPEYINLAWNEDIHTIEGRSGKYIDSLTLSTNRAQTVTMGGSGGSPFQFSTPSGMRIVDLWGRSGKYLDAIAPVLVRVD